jgi:hypothetical protein
VSCDYLDSEVLAAIDAARERLGEQGLDVMTCGASGVVRALRS